MHYQVEKKPKLKQMENDSDRSKDGERQKGDMKSKRSDQREPSTKKKSLDISNFALKNWNER